MKIIQTKNYFNKKQTFSKTTRSWEGQNGALITRYTCNIKLELFLSRRIIFVKNEIHNKVKTYRRISLDGFIAVSEICHEDDCSVVTRRVFRSIKKRGHNVKI